MYSDTKREGEAPVKQEPSTEGFIDFLSKQPAGEMYEWFDAEVCPVGRYAQSLGMKYYDIEPRSDRLRWNQLAFHQPRTYGDLLYRVRYEGRRE